MQQGKVPYNILKRSVIRPVLGSPRGLPGSGLDSSVFSSGKDGVFVMTANPVIVTGADGVYYGVHRCLADLYAAGAVPVGIEDVVLLPVETEEATLQHLMNMLRCVCEEAGVPILGGHTTVSAAVTRPVITLSGVGRAEAEPEILHPSRDLVVTKWIGLAGTALLASEKEQSLLTRYTVDFVEHAKSMKALVQTGAEIGIAGNFHAVIHNVSEGGILAALWELLDSAGLGMDIDLKRIPIRQETVELTEYFGLNPYQMLSTGSYLMAVEDGQALVEALAEAGIPASVIGKTTSEKARIIRRDEEVRYLDRPAMDELYRVGLLY